MPGSKLYKTAMILFSFFMSSLSFAQGKEKKAPEENSYKEYPLEKIYIHTDKVNYSAGDTIWLKAFLMADYKPTSISSSICIQLVTDGGNSVARVILPIEYGTAVGNFELKDSLPSGNYSLQAYTIYGTAYSVDPWYRKNFQVYNIKDAGKMVQKKPTPRFNFFPESGNLVAGIENMVAFKCTDASGYPMQASGLVYNTAGTEVAKFSTVHDGMGKFAFTPTSGEQYSAHIKYEIGTETDLVLPTAVMSGAGLQVTHSADEIIYNIDASVAQDVASKPKYLLIMQGNKVVYTTALTLNDKLTGSIPSKNLPSGVLQLNVNNALGAPLFERLIFNNNDNWQMQGTLKSEVTSLKAKGKNVLRFVPQDNAKTSLAISVVDADASLGNRAADNIASAFLLSEEIKGYVHNAIQYVGVQSDSTRIYADLVMMTNGWRRFNWNGAEAAQRKLPEVERNRFISMEGVVYNKFSGKAIGNSTITAVVSNAGEVADMLKIPVDSAGRFHVSEITLHDSVRMQIMSLGNNIQNASLKIYSPNISTRFNLSPRSGATMWTPQLVTSEERSIMKERRTNEIELEGIKLRSYKVKTPSEITERKYTQNSLFAGGEIKTLDFINENQGVTATNNVLTYLSRGSVTGVSEKSKNLFVFRNAQSLSGGFIPMTFYLDNVEIDNVSLLQTINISQVALMKLYSNNLLVSSGVGGILAIFTKDADDLALTGANNRSGYPTLTVEGYSPVKEFYVPDYENLSGPDLKKSDLRTTLYWNPAVETNSDNKDFVFTLFNNDKAKRLKVIVTGFNEQGKMLYMEKIIE